MVPETKRLPGAWVWERLGFFYIWVDPIKYRFPMSTIVLKLLYWRGFDPESMAKYLTSWTMICPPAASFCVFTRKGRKKFGRFTFHTRSAGCFVFFGKNTLPGLKDNCPRSTIGRYGMPTGKRRAI